MAELNETELEAAVFRRLRDHLRERTDVQNIDLMNLSGFCRNCLSRWYQEAANERGIDLDKNAAREIFYGMTMDDWKANYQSDASEAQKAALMWPSRKTSQTNPDHASSLSAPTLLLTVVSPSSERVAKASMIS